MINALASQQEGPGFNCGDVSAGATLSVITPEGMGDEQILKNCEIIIEVSRSGIEFVVSFSIVKADFCQ